MNQTNGKGFRVYPFGEPPQELLDWIMQADDKQIGDVVSAILFRYKALFPEWEVAFVSLPLEPEEHARAVENLIEFLRSGNLFTPL